MLRASQAKWLPLLAKAYKDKAPLMLRDDAQLGIDPIHESLFMMGVRAKLSVNEMTAVCVALGMAAAGVALVVLAVIDPEPTSKLALLIAGGIMLIGTGGFGAIRILVNQKPPLVKVGPKRFGVSWE